MEGLKAPPNYPILVFTVDSISTSCRVFLLLLPMQELLEIKENKKYLFLLIGLFEENC